MKRGAEAEVDLIKFMTDVRKGANSKKLDANAKVFAHDLKQQQLAALQSMNPDGANFEDECRKAKPLADKLTDMVATDILASSNKKEMVHVIEFYLKVAHESLKAGDYQSALFLSTAVEGLEIDRLGINQDASKAAKAQLAEIRGKIDNNARFQQFNQFLKTQNGPNIVPITSSIQAQYVSLKEKKTLADTDEVKESLQTGINETKGILRNYVQNAHPEPMQSNLMTKLAAPTLPYDTAYAAGEKDQPEPLSIEGRSRTLKKAGQPFNPNTPEAKASTAAVNQYLKTQPATPLPQLPPAIQQAAVMAPQPVAAPSNDKGKEEEKQAAPILEAIEQPAATQRNKQGPKVDRKGRKRIEEDDGPDPLDQQRPATAASNVNVENEKAQVAAMQPVGPAAADPKANKNHDMRFMDVTPINQTPKAAKAANQEATKNVAQELMQTSIKMAAKIPSSEIVNNQWETPNSIIDQMVKYTVGLTERVRDSVLLAGSKEEQIKTFQFMLDVMNESLKAGDVNTAMAIYQGLDNTPVNRLKYLVENKDIARDFEKAEEFFSPTKNMKNVRDFSANLAKKGKVVVPSVALFTKDLTFARDGNKTDFKLNTEGEKQLSSIFENFKRSEKANAQDLSKAEKMPAVMEQWLNAPRLSEKEADDHSAAIKPRGVDVPYLNPVPTREQVFAAKEAAALAAQQPIAAMPPVQPYSSATVGPSSSAVKSEPDIDFENDAANKVKKPMRDDEVKDAAPKTPKRKTIKVSPEQKEQIAQIASNRPSGPAPTPPPADQKARLKALSKAYKASKKAEQSQMAQQQAAPTKLTAASVAAGIDPIVKDAKQTDAKNKAQDMLNGLAKLNAPQVNVSDAGKVEFTVNGARNRQALQRSLEKAGIECQVTKGKGGTTFSFDADKLNTLSNDDVKKLVKDTRAEFKELTKELRERRRAAAIPEEQKATVSTVSKAEEAKQLADLLRSKAPPPQPVAKVEPPVITVASSPPVDAAAQLATMLNNPMPSSITAPPLESVNINHPNSNNLATMEKPPARRQQARAAVANGNEDVKADVKPVLNNYNSSFSKAQSFWKDRDMQVKQAAEEKNGPNAETGRTKPIKPT